MAKKKAGKFRDRTEVVRSPRVINDATNVLALVKGTERYVFLYDDASRAETLNVLGRFAVNPELSFTWYDASVLAQRVRQTAGPSRRW